MQDVARLVLRAREDQHLLCLLDILSLADERVGLDESLLYFHDAEESDMGAVVESQAKGIQSAHGEHNHYEH